MKTKRFIVLKRVVGGDYDLVCTLYGTSGLITLFVKEGLLPSSPFLGTFEPFNVVGLEFLQRGNVTVPLDVRYVQRYSYLARSYTRFRWMSAIASFVLKHLSFYDERIYNFVESSMLRKVRSLGVHILDFKLRFINLYGIQPKFLSKEVPMRGSLRIDLSNGDLSRSGDVKVKVPTIRLLQRINRSTRKDLSSIKIDKSLFKEADRLLEAYIDYHTK